MIVEQSVDRRNRERDFDQGKMPLISTRTMAIRGTTTAITLRFVIQSGRME
jgi:hypothetical protein